MIDEALPDTEFWCRELDGTWVHLPFEMIPLALRPGRWKYGPNGYPYWKCHENSVTVTETGRKTNT